MLYFTKEYYAAERLSFAYGYVKASKRAEYKDEKFYKRIYEWERALFLHNERSGKWGKDCALGEEFFTRRFAERQEKRIALYGGLPQEIREKIADLRVFALGYASGEVKRALKPYCAVLKSAVRLARERADAETYKAEKRLYKKIGLAFYGGRSIAEAEERADGLIVRIGEGGGLFFPNGHISEESNLAEACGKIVAVELHCAEEGFETHFLLAQEEEARELTIRSTDIYETK